MNLMLAIALFVYGIGLLGCAPAWITTTYLGKSEGFCASTVIAASWAVLGTLMSFIVCTGILVMLSPLFI